MHSHEAHDPSTVALRTGPVRPPDHSDTRATRPQRHTHPADGMAWLVADRARGDFLCYWYFGRSGAHLAQQTRVATAEDAVAWGRARTDSVRIRTVDGRSRWAGSAPRPDGMSDTWTPRRPAGSPAAARGPGGAPC